MEHLAAVQPAEDLEHAGNLTPDDPLRPPFCLPIQEDAQVAVRRILEREEVIRDWRPGGGRAEIASKITDRARVAIEQLPK